MTLDGTRSGDADGGDSIASWAWSFAGGAKGAGPKVTRTFARAGTYKVTLTVTDTTGRTGSAVRAITVVAPGGGGVVADRTPPTLAGVHVAPRRAGRRARVRFSVSEPATVVVRMKRRTRGGWKRVASARRTVGAGARSMRVPARLRRGRHRITIAATDAPGNRGTAVRRAFRVR